MSFARRCAWHLQSAVERLPDRWYMRLNRILDHGPSTHLGSGSPVVDENRRPGSPASEWTIQGAGDASIQGFATDISVNVGDTVAFKIDTDAPSYGIDIYRLGYYGGAGARRVATLAASSIVARRQPAGVIDASVGLVDCGNWEVSASWDVPRTTVSGVYVAKLTRADTGGSSHIVFIVRDDDRAADILFQTADPTWQAYNRYGGASLYTGSPTDRWDSPSRARKVSYNRPFTTRGDDAGRSFLFSNEYPTLRFLERNGYDVAYAAGVDVDRFGGVLTRHHVFLSVGHDEYWSYDQRRHVEAALAAGVHLMFLSGNDVYWRTRFERSIDGRGTTHRTLVCYKETWDNASTDPSGRSTATWRDPRFVSTDTDSGPENGLTGTLCMANDTDLPVTVTAAQGRLRLWRATGLASMRAVSTALAPHTVGYESDEDVDNGFRPAGLIHLSTTKGPSAAQLIDFGSRTMAAETTHHVTLHRAPSGALVFDVGTIQWGWGLDRHHDGTHGAADSRMQQAVVNMLADMNIQPATLMPGLVAATASADRQPPVSTISTPTPEERIANGSVITVSGTAIDRGGGHVAGVDVSIDGGRTWHPAVGTTEWYYAGIVHGHGRLTIQARATDDSANLEGPAAEVVVTVVGPCSLFGAGCPASEDSGADVPVELGVRFWSLCAGYITGIRYYKSPANAGPHIGTLWTDDGHLLARGTFTDETERGWQVLPFATPVPIVPRTPYVASYSAPHGHVSCTTQYFYYHDHDAAPLVAPATRPGRAVLNGVRGRLGGCPTTPVDGDNFYVDVIFEPTPDSADGRVMKRASAAAC